MKLNRVTINARVKLIFVLLFSSLVVYIAQALVINDNTSKFFSQVNEETISALSSHVNDLINVTLEQTILVLLDIENKLSGNIDKDELLKVLSTYASNRSRYIRGVVYIDTDMNTAGYPEIFWENFASKEKEIIVASITNNESAIVYSQPFYMNFGSRADLPVTAITKIIYNEDYERKGILSIIVDYSLLLESISVFSNNHELSILLYDKTGRFLSSSHNYVDEISKMDFPQKSQINVEAIIDYLKENNLYYSVQKMKQSPGWIIVVAGDMGRLQERFKPFNNVFFIIFIIGFFALPVIYICISLWFTKPLVTIVEGMKNIAKGDFDYKINVNKNKDEFTQVAQEFNHMGSLIKKLINKLNAAHEKKKELDFKLLLSQINPHFIYNTLNTIDMMVELNTKDEVHEALNNLVDLLKYNLDRTDKLSSLEEEFDFIRKYLHIKLVRYDYSFDVEVSNPGCLRDYKVLKLLIQPIVENAVFHGVQALTDRRGKIWIYAYEEENKLVITVEDNGVGMSKEKLNKILSNEFKDIKQGDYCIGVINVHDRIRTYYGNKYGLKIESSIGIGTKVYIVVPMINQKQSIEERKD